MATLSSSQKQRFTPSVILPFSHRFNPKAKDKKDNSKSWCFLENVRDPEEPRSGCFPDVKWSSRDGRFWSSEACYGLPPPEYAAEGADVKVYHPLLNSNISLENTIEISTSATESNFFEADDNLELDVNFHAEYGTDVDESLDLELDSPADNQTGTEFDSEYDFNAENETQTEYPISFSF